VNRYTWGVVNSKGYCYGYYIENAATFGPSRGQIYILSGECKRGFGGSNKFGVFNITTGDRNYWALIYNRVGWNDDWIRFAKYWSRGRKQFSIYGSWGKIYNSKNLMFGTGVKHYKKPVDKER